MNPGHTRARGEGKVGCIVSLLVLLIGIAAGVKIFPVFYSDNNLLEYAGDLAGQAGLKPVPMLESMLRAKAQALDIPEALDESAMTISVHGDSQSGICTITFNYSRTVDLYGVYPLTIETHKTITKNYVDAR